MATPSSDDVASALATVARRALIRGKDVDLPRLGRLEVRHEHSTIDERPDGETILQPPKDYVVFIPASE
jgi:nucleoid DNA-binding protein